MSFIMPLHGDVWKFALEITSIAEWIYKHAHRNETKRKKSGRRNRHDHMSSPDMFACLKYFIPTHAMITHTQDMTAVRMIRAG